MDVGEILVIVMFVTTLACLLAGFPVAFTLSGVAALFGLFSYAFGAFDISFLRAMPQRIFGNAMWNEVLIAVPLFVFMGVMLERSKVAEELLEAMGRLFGGLRGGLGISVIAVGALLAASTGIVGATVVTMGLLSLPTMLRRGYDPKLATGAICALRYARPDHPALHRAGDPRRADLQRLCRCPARHRQLVARGRSRSATCSPAPCSRGWCSSRSICSI